MDRSILGEWHQIMVRVKCRELPIAIVAISLIAYVGLYLALSRRGYAESDHYQSEGFFYFTLDKNDTWAFRHVVCVYVFWPLNQLDCALGTGRGPSSVPMWDLS